MIEIIETLKKYSHNFNEHYAVRYLNFINKCYKLNISNMYIERHHIIPKSFKGSNDELNIIQIGARHHYIAHLLLVKATNSPKMIKALHRMVYSKNYGRNYKISSRMYAYIREKHSKVVSDYSKGTVVARHLSGEVRRIPKKLFDYYNGILYTAIAKGRKDSEETRKRKSLASKRKRYVKQGTKIRSVSASLYSYNTPNGFCLTSKELLELYPTFNKNTLSLFNNTDYIITQKFISIHPDFNNYVGMTFNEIGITRVLRKHYDK